MEEYSHLDKTPDALQRWYNEKFKLNQVGNMSFEMFKAWYKNNAHTCHYCGLSVQESQKIVRTGLLKSNRFPQNGKVGRGTSRGMWMEIDRYNPRGNYELGNIVPACYFCNNDKSDVFNGDQYKLFMNDRIGFLRSLIGENKEGIENPNGAKSNSTQTSRIKIEKLKPPSVIKPIDLPRIPDKEDKSAIENEDLFEDDFSSNFNSIDNLNPHHDTDEIIEWRCEICDGDSSTGCLLYDRECQRS